MVEVAIVMPTRRIGGTHSGGHDSIVATQGVLSRRVDALGQGMPVVEALDVTRLSCEYGGRPGGDRSPAACVGATTHSRPALAARPGPRVSPHSYNRRMTTRTECRAPEFGQGGASRQWGGNAGSSVGVAPIRAAAESCPGLTGATAVAAANPWGGMLP